MIQKKPAQSNINQTTTMLRCQYWFSSCPLSGTPDQWRIWRVWELIKSIRPQRKSQKTLHLFKAIREVKESKDLLFWPGGSVSGWAMIEPLFLLEHLMFFTGLKIDLLTETRERNHLLLTMLSRVFGCFPSTYFNRSAFHASIPRTHLLREFVKL